MRKYFILCFVLVICLFSADEDSIPPPERDTQELEEKLKELELVTPDLPMRDSPKIIIVPYYALDVKPTPISIPSPYLGSRFGLIRGRTVVKALVDIDGSVAEVDILQSSGDLYLDDMALRAAKKAKFTPAEHQGRPVRVWVAIPFTFTQIDEHN